MTRVDLLARKARRRIRGEIEAQAAAASADLKAAFQRLRNEKGLPPIALVSWRYYRLPERFKCPECGGRTIFEVDEWSTVTGTPTAGGIRVMCQDEEEEMDRAMQADEDPTWSHNHWQDPGWMSLIRRVERFCASRVRVYG